MMSHTFGPGRLLALACFACLAMPSLLLAAQQTNPPAPAQERRTVEATRLDSGERIALDGILDEPVWERAVPAKDFIQIDPQNGSRPPSRPRCASRYNQRRALPRRHLPTIPSPTSWLGYQRRRDEFLQSDDRFMWTIDTFLDAQVRLLLRDEPVGTHGRLAAGRRHRTESAVGRHLERTVAPQRLRLGPRDRDPVPLAELRSRTATTWGINFQRTVRRKNEDSIWMGWARNQGLRRMTNAGLRHRHPQRHPGARSRRQAVRPGHRRAAPGRGQRALRRRCPGRRRRLLQPDAGPPQRAHGQHRLRTDRGRPAPGEPDPLLAVLPREARLLPRRAPSFDFGSPPQRRPHRQPVLQPTHRPRRRRTGTPQTINYGGKLTGQMGRQDVGFLQVRTGEDTGTDRRRIHRRPRAAPRPRASPTSAASTHGGTCATTRPTHGTQLDWTCASQRTGFGDRRTCRWPHGPFTAPRPARLTARRRLEAFSTIQTTGGVRSSTPGKSVRTSTRPSASSPGVTIGAICRR